MKLKNAKIKNAKNNEGRDYLCDKGNKYIQLITMFT